MHASMPPKWILRRLRGYLPESQERVEVGSADEEALPPRGASPPPSSARVDYVESKFSVQSSQPKKNEVLSILSNASKSLKASPNVDLSLIMNSSLLSL